MRAVSASALQSIREKNRICQPVWLKYLNERFLHFKTEEILPGNVSEKSELIVTPLRGPFSRLCIRVVLAAAQPQQPGTELSATGKAELPPPACFEPSSC